MRDDAVLRRALPLGRGLGRWLKGGHAAPVACQSRTMKAVIRIR